MKLNKKDIDDLMQIVYWASAVKTDLQGLKAGATPPGDYIDNALRCITELDAAAERIYLGKNR